MKRTLAVLAILIAFTAFDLSAQATVTRDKPQYPVGERLIATFGGSSSPTDWLGIYQAGGGHGSGFPSITWLYTNGTRTAGSTTIPNGKVVFLPINLAQGNYDLRFFSNDGYTVLAKTSFKVVSGAVSAAPAPAGDLTVMTFNIWVNATNGFGGVQAVADAIAKVGADVIGLQESSSATTLQVLARLRLKSGYGSAAGSGATGVISRYPITKTYTSSGLYGYGVRIRLPGQHDIRFFNSHLTAYPYGPYSVRDKRKLSDVLKDENKTRLAEMQAILNKLINDKSNDPCLPTFLVGDHNSPSHLDWTPANSDQNFGVSLVWPVSNALTQIGFRDLYREVHPDPVATRSFTWTPGYPKGQFDSNDVHDRIDMLYFHPGCTGEDYWSVQTYAYDADPWPADHRAVVASVDRVDKRGSVPSADLRLDATCATGAAPSALPELRICYGGDTFLLHFDTPSGKFKNAAPVLAFQCFLTGQSLPGWSMYPASFLDPGRPLFEILLIGSSFQNGGYPIAAKVPNGAGGVTCRLQGYAFHAAAANGLFEASNAIDVQVR